MSTVTHEAPNLIEKLYKPTNDHVTNVVQKEKHTASLKENNPINRLDFSLLDTRKTGN